MGIVYMARHLQLDRVAVVKVLRASLAENESMVKRFINEAKVAASIGHSGIVDVLDIGHLENEQVFILMEYLKGESLGKRLEREGKLDERVAIAFAQQIARALVAAHDRSVIHRDLKPDNIFLVPDAEVVGGERVKLLDFGIAKLLERDVSLVTKTGAMMGTPAYMSPEQCRGAGKVDHRSDLYTLGVILFEMLCGRRPFVKAGYGSYILAHVNEPPPSVIELNPDASPLLAQVIARLLAKHPKNRFQSSRELVAALRAVRVTTQGGTDLDLDATPSHSQANESLNGSNTGREHDSLDSLSEPNQPTPSISPSIPPESQTGETMSVTRGFGSRWARSGMWKTSLLAGGIAFLLGMGVVAMSSGADEPHREPARTNPVGDDGTQSVHSQVPVDAMPGLDERCDDGDKLACWQRAESHERDGDTDNQLAFLTKACAAGHGRGCLRAGQLLDEDGPREDDAKAVGFYERACDSEIFDGCRLAAMMYDEGTEVAEKSAGLTERLFKRAAVGYDAECGRGSGSSCQYAAMLYATGKGVDRNLRKVKKRQKQAFGHFTRHCDEDRDAEACFHAASSYAIGVGTRKSAKKAHDYFERACDWGYQGACEALASRN